MSGVVCSDPAEPPPAARGRRPAPSGRSRQQVQREKAPQMAASSALQPGQQLAEPPPNQSPGGSTPDLILKASDVMEHQEPPAEATSPGVKELDKEEVEVLV